MSTKQAVKAADTLARIAIVVGALNLLLALVAFVGWGLYHLVMEGHLIPAILIASTIQALLGGLWLELKPTRGRKS